MKLKNLLHRINWLFIIGSFIGYLIEVLCYYYKHHIFLNKKGLIFGPFKPIYGIGIVLLSLFAKKTKNTNTAYILIVGIICGSIYEYILSLFQEFIFHTSTWNYSKFNYNINGRIYLPYCIGWGIATVVFIKFLYPYIDKLIKKIPFYLTIIASILMTYNVVLTTIVVIQYSNRSNGIYSNNTILKIIDKKYNDEFMKTTFPKIKVIKKD